MTLVWITTAQYVKNYELILEFNTLEKKRVDLEFLIENEPFRGLKKIELFKNFKLNEWTIEWENGLDISPDFLYKHGTFCNNLIKIDSCRDVACKVSTTLTPLYLNIPKIPTNPNSDN